MAKEIAINYLTHNKIDVINCSAMLKGNEWHVSVTMEKNQPVTKVVQINADSGKIVTSDFLGGLDKSKLGALAFGLYYYVVSTFFNDTPTQGAVSLVNMVSQT